MEIDRERLKAAQQKTKELLAAEEQKRAERRLVALLASLEGGNSEVLLNDELMENLPDLIRDYCQDGDYDKASVLFEKLGECARNENKRMRERAVMALSLSLSGLDQKKHHPALIQQVINLLQDWLRFETDFLSVCSSVCGQLQDNGIRMLEEGRWKECSVLLDLFYQIQSGSLEKSNSIRSVVCKAQDKMALDHVLEELTLVSLRGRGERRALAESLLTRLGRRAAIYLLEILLKCQNREDRIRLVGFIPATGNVSIRVIEEYLKKDLPWYGIRNIILMITAMDDQRLLSLIMPFLTHEDIRIQQQVLDSITEIVPGNPGPYLLKALPVVNDSLKVRLVSLIGVLGEPNASDAFLDLLGQRDSFSPDVCDELLQKLAVQVRLSDSIRAVNLLNMVLDERAEEHDPDTDPVSIAVNHTLQILKPRFSIYDSSDTDEPAESDLENFVDVSLSDVSFHGDQAAQNIARQKVHAINEKVAKILGEKTPEHASQYLFEECVAAAENKDFETAELLRDRILEVDPNALVELIKAGEKIEQEQSTSVNSHHISIWQDLYDSLSTDEFNALYFALESRSFSPGSVIVEQGAIRSELYFINSGEARLACLRGKDEIFLKRIGAGEIIGSGPFFDVSVWTVSLTALGETDIHVLERERYLELLEQFPNLESCLREYCKKTDAVPKLLRMSGEDRRHSVRYPLSLIVKHSLLDRHGNANMRSFKGEIADLSCFGLSFTIRITRKENARLMLGRSIRTLIPVPGSDSITVTGKIVAVRFQESGENDFLIHVQFDEPIVERVVKFIVA
jgi:CRP-like cAMP-binding protein